MRARALNLDPDVCDRAERMLGNRIVSWEPRTAGLTHAIAGVAHLAGGAAIFLKAAREHHSSREIGAELRVLRRVEASFMPDLLAWDDGDPPMFALEDLSHGHWPEPYPRDVGGLVAVLDELRSLAPPPELNLPPLELPDLNRVRTVAAGARVGAPALAAWIAEHAPTIEASVDEMERGRVLVHGDLWYSNICFMPRRVVLVDWSHARRGAPWHDAATVSIDLILERWAPLDIPDARGWAAAYLASAVGALGDGPAPSISDPDRWRLDIEELEDGAAWWLASEAGLEQPPRLGDREPGPP